MPSRLITLYQSHFGTEPLEVQTLQAHASDRKIYRLICPANNINKTVIGVVNPNPKENKAFIYFANHFLRHGLNVPKIFISDSELSCYIEEDLGEATLYDLLLAARTPEDKFPKKIEALYEQILKVLPKFQIIASKDLDYSYCETESEFRAVSMKRDMEFFERSFLSKTNIKYDSRKLHEDFNTLISFLSDFPCDYFMYRDFQSRNIMFKSGQPYFIDFQGGRRGPLQYDVASLLYQASAQIPEESKSKLISAYLKEAKKFIAINDTDFYAGLDGFIIVRILQVLGTYGKQGLENKKEYFIRSIPRAVANLFEQSQSGNCMKGLPTLQSICYSLQEYAKSFNTSY